MVPAVPGPTPNEGPPPPVVIESSRRISQPDATPLMSRAVNGMWAGSTLSESIVCETNPASRRPGRVASVPRASASRTLDILTERVVSVPGSGSLTLGVRKRQSIPIWLPRSDGTHKRSFASSGGHCCLACYEDVQRLAHRLGAAGDGVSYH